MDRIFRTHMLSQIILVSGIFISASFNMQQLYFSSPQESIGIITELLTLEDWETLSSYYYLDKDRQELRDSLMSGSYFMAEEQPEAAHPGGFWRYKHPFPPGFKYSYHESLPGDIIRVNLTIEIDQGEGMTQTGQAYFYMKEFPEGFMILPEVFPVE